VAGKEIAVKRYVVRLSAEERERLKALVHSGKSLAQLLTRARILLKADVSEAGEGWSDSAIAAALDTSINNVARARQQLVEEGFETLKRKYNPSSARPRIFHGAEDAHHCPWRRQAERLLRPSQAKEALSPIRMTRATSASSVNSSRRSARISSVSASHSGYGASD
jgi:hypothetical protein